MLTGITRQISRTFDLNRKSERNQKNIMEKKNIVVLFGGQSSEHVVSCMSVQNVAANINEEKYNVILVGITEDGHWVKVDSLSQVKDDTWRESKTGAVLSPDAKEKCLIVTENGSFEKIPVDVVFPVLHGLYGEDGTVQGILELAKIPYVGCGVLASAVSMDKLSTKRMVSGLGICQAAYVSVMKAELKDMDAVIAKIEKEIPYPVFVKPSNAGSSRGVTRADNREELITGLKEAADNDRRILVEEMIVGREIECGVFGDGASTKASGVGEILAAASMISTRNTTMRSPRPSLTRSFLTEPQSVSVRLPLRSLMQWTATAYPAWISS